MVENRVVITGMGAITPLGLTSEKFWGNLLKGKSGIGRMTLCDSTDTHATLQVKSRILIRFNMLELGNPVGWPDSPS